MNNEHLDSAGMMQETAKSKGTYKLLKERVEWN